MRIHSSTHIPKDKYLLFTQVRHCVKDIHVGHYDGQFLQVLVTESPNNPLSQFTIQFLVGIKAKYGVGHSYTHNLPTSNL